MTVRGKVSGILLSLKAEEGHRVRQGEVLAEIDARELEAQARSAEAALRFAQSTLERSEQLFKQQIITIAELERDRASHEAAKASSEQLKTRLGYAHVVAPIRIFPSADSATRLVPVEVALSGNQLPGLRPGYTARATLALDKRDGALLVPSRAYQDQPARARST